MPPTNCDFSQCQRGFALQFGRPACYYDSARRQLDVMLGWHAGLTSAIFPARSHQAAHRLSWKLSSRKSSTFPAAGVGFYTLPSPAFGSAANITTGGHAMTWLEALRSGDQVIVKRGTGSQQEVVRRVDYTTPKQIVINRQRFRSDDTEINLCLIEPDYDSEETGYIPAGWYEASECGSDGPLYSDVVDEVLLWQPLPALPEQEVSND